MALYNDRAYAYERMKELDPVLDKDPSTNNISRMVADDERNRLAFLELEHYEKHSTFLYKHPILTNHKQELDLDALRKASPERFTNELVNADKNITRYESMIRNKKYRNQEECNAWQKHIDQFKEKKEIMTKLLSS